MKGNKGNITTEPVQNNAMPVSNVVTMSELLYIYHDILYLWSYSVSILLMQLFICSPNTLPNPMDNTTNILSFGRGVTCEPVQFLAIFVQVLV